MRAHARTSVLAACLTFVAFMLTGCGANTTATDSAASRSAPSASVSSPSGAVSTGSAGISGELRGIAWTCERKGGQMSCVCDGAAAACQESVANPTKVKGESTTGTVKWFDDAKGFGFISTEGGGDVFAHFSAIDINGARTMSEGQCVSFNVTTGAKGKQAENIRAC